MRPTVESEDEIEYQNYLKQETWRGCKTLLVLAIILFPLFSVLDYFAQSEHFLPLSLIRFCTTGIYLLILILVSWKEFLREPFWLSAVLLGLGSASITLMCLVLDGYKSPYYAGVNLVALAGVLLLPIGGRRMAITLTIVIGIYAIGVLQQQDFELDELTLFINNMFFLISTGVIGVTAAAFTDRMRRESFYQFQEIRRSSDALRTKLLSQNNSLEGLADEIIAKHTENQKSLKQNEQFVSIASHELKTPLTSLKLQVDVAKRRLGHSDFDKAAFEKLIKSFDQQISRIIKIVDEMLDLSRIQIGKLEVCKTKVDLTALVKGIEERFIFQNVTRNLKFTYAFPGEIWGEFDPYKVEQVILNLISNGLKYGDGTVEVRLWKACGWDAVLSVSDDGPGISEADQQKIFDRFERGSAPENSSGLGLGLYLCKQIIDLHGGKIELKSNSGEGTEFIVYL